MPDTPVVETKVAPSLPALNNNLYRVLALGRIEGQVTSTVFYFLDDRPTAIAGPALLDDLLDALIAPDGFVDLYAACCAGSFTLERLVGDLPMDERVIPFEREVNRPGQATGTSEPTQIAVTLARYSAVRGRKGRSRVSMPGVPRGKLSGSVVADDLPWINLTTYLQLGIATPITIFKAAVFSPGNLTYQTAGAAPVVKWVVRTTVGTCRRRKLGVGI